MKKNKAGAVVRKVESGVVHILLLHNLPHDYWLLPKGHIEDGESAKDAAKRELLEETGLNVNLIKFLGVATYLDNNNNEVLLNIFLAEAVDGELTPEDEDHELIWLPLNEAIDKLSYQNLKDFLISCASSIETINS
ncbi:MAG: putative mutator protein MutT4 [bacterium ADurb.Bin212]|nr:MAG: putative mutator protein MutT4 [bacterium ADurb.Bin212]